MPDFLYMTYAVAVLTLIFSPAPFAVLIYALLSIYVTNIEEWITMTFILLISQAGYAVWKGLRR
jgi:hypothetical protein